MPSLIDTMADAIRQIAERLAQRRELEALSPDELRAMATDLALAPGDLAAAVRGGPNAGWEAQEMLAQFGVDPADVLAAQYSTRDAARACLHCDGRDRCHAELDAGTARAHAAEFCPNAADFESIARLRG